MFHESVNMISAYHLFLFTDTYSDEVQLGAGISFFINVLILISGNVSIIFYDAAV
jgi:hypothetical protein